MYRLLVSSDGVPGEHTVDVARDVALVGRRAGADVPLPHADVGGVHLRLERHGQEVTLVDGAIASGTAVNGVRLAAGARRVLADGDAIVVAGRFRLRYVARSPAREPTGAVGTAALARAMVHDLLAALSEGAPETTPWFEIVAGPDAGRRVALPAPGRSLVVGRGETCDVRIVDADLSRDHVRVTRGWAGTTIAELGSKNGTRAGGKALPVGEERPLRDGDRVELGGTALVLRDPTDAYLRQLEAMVPAAPEGAAPVAVAGPVTVDADAVAASTPADAADADAVAASTPAADAVPVADAAAPRRSPWPTVVAAALVLVAIAALVMLLRA